MIEQLLNIQAEKEILVPKAVKDILAEDYWSQIKMSQIYHQILKNKGIDPEEYETKEGESFSGLSKSDRFLYMLIPELTLLTIPTTNPCIIFRQTFVHARTYVEDHLSELDLESYEKKTLYHTETVFQQKEYKERLLSFISEQFEVPFGFNELTRSLTRSGKKVKSEIYLRHMITSFVDEGLLNQRQEKNRIYYQINRQNSQIKE